MLQSKRRNVIFYCCLFGVGAFMLIKVKLSPQTPAFSEHIISDASIEKQPEDRKLSAFLGQRADIQHLAGFVKVVARGKKPEVNVPKNKPTYLTQETTLSTHANYQGGNASNKLGLQIANIQTRQKLMAAVCENSGLNRSITQMSLSEIEDLKANRFLKENIYIDTKRKLLFCTVHKAASTSLRNLLHALELGVQSVKGEVHKLWGKWNRPANFIENYSATYLKSNLQNFTRIMFVRHPLERIYSCYQDKIKYGTVMNNDPRTPFLAREIILATRGINITEPWMYDEEFMQAEISYKFNVSKSKMMMANQSHLSLQGRAARKTNYTNLVAYLQLQPISFVEFVHYAANNKWPYLTDLMDTHWVPYQDMCHPCTFQYRYIGHVETMDDDIKLLFDSIKAGFNKAPTKNKSKVNNQYSNLHNLTCPNKQFGTLCDDVKKAYSVDYEMFGYKRPWATS